MQYYPILKGRLETIMNIHKPLPIFQVTKKERSSLDFNSCHLISTSQIER